ncbi:MAG: hypothetical protein ACRDXC_13290, partial [Acidimicrobiales bacterium]
LDSHRRQPASLTSVASERHRDLASTPTLPPAIREGEHAGDAVGVIDAEVTDVKSSVDEELDAYNRYLFELSRNGRPKKWTRRRPRRSGDDPCVDEHASPTPTTDMPALRSADQAE